MVIGGGSPPHCPTEGRLEVKYDVWKCMKHGEWTVASIPHQPKCPLCGVGGWWQRFDEVEEGLRRAAELAETGCRQAEVEAWEKSVK